MKTLIVKLGATGDVVRTTPLLEKLGGDVVWVTEERNKILLNGLTSRLRSFSWQERESVPQVDYDLIINLEDTLDVAQFLQRFRGGKWFGAYSAAADELRYTEDSRRWFDLSLISSYGREKADRLKFRNRRTYQELIFEGLGFVFQGEGYLLPTPLQTELSGDVAIAPEAGPVWPMKNWSYYDELKKELESQGMAVNVLPKRSSLLEHLGDVRNHRCLVGGDSLPMHFALGTETLCVSLFTCTSPWEIYDYGLQKKIVSPLLGEFFYKRGFDERAITAISVKETLDAVMAQLKHVPQADERVTNK